ncbi:7-cyano-7-deazaguanine synthase QueC [Streptomyces sp. NPDC017936]|uniref:7-cyano-7-deazaguanine synthase QueC n=1 Tax=Streptomyces sp. NPDC017936 TaxID=3365016 RepID=UPI003788A0A0
MIKPLAVLSFSGGMDSTTLAARYASKGYDLLLLSFNYGQRHRRRELEAAAGIAGYLGAEHHVVDLSSVAPLLPGTALTDPGVDVPDGHYAEESMKSTVVPNRNAIMASIALGVASARGAELIGLGVHAGDHAVYPDCRPEFVEALREMAAVALAGMHVPQIATPFVHMTKTEIAAYADSIKAPVHMSWSCYKGGEVHCGTCGTCTERKEAFADAGLTDPTEYAA